LFIADAPLATLTIFPSAGTDAVSHTFSYWQAPSRCYGGVESIIADFIAADFEGF
jgi:hypothetical protein